MGRPQGDLIENAVIGIARLDPGGRVVAANGHFAAMLGRDAQDLTGLQLHDIVSPDDLPATLDAFIRVIETRRPAVVEHRYRRADGSTVRISSTACALEGNDPAGEIMVFAGPAPDRASRTSDELRLLLDVAADGFYCLDREGRTTLCNAAAVRMLGYSRDEDVLGHDLHSRIHHSHPDGSPYPAEDCPILGVLRTGNHAHVADEIFFRADGSRFPVEYWVRPIVRDGEIQGAVCTFIDLTERKRLDARQEMLNRELSHRVKNMLSMVQAIVGQTLRTRSDSREAMRLINERLVALSHAHEVLLRTRWGTASMMDVVEGAIALHRPDPARFRLGGPRVDLGSKAALAITLALHELCTNAAKYGALSSEGGTVAIEWSINGGAADSSLHLKWREAGGPPVATPTRKGFGSKLIGEAIGYDLRGQASLQFADTGVSWELKAPMAALAQ